MDISSEVTKVKNLLDKTQEVLIVTHENPTFDSIGSSLALYLGLTSLGKKVTVACPDPITVELSNFVGVNKVVSDIGQKNFVISLDYVDGSIERVSYNIEGHKFNLIIEHRPGFEPFSPDKIHYSYAGAYADLIFAIDTIHLGGLKKLYETDKDLFTATPVVNIDRHPNNAQFGQVNLVDPGASSTAELVAQVLSAVGVALMQDIATNFLNAVFAATNAFQSPQVTPAAFELVAACLKAGGRRFGKPSIQEERPKVEGLVEAVPAEVKKPKEEKLKETPADWLKPKIFKSSSPGQLA